MPVKLGYKAIDDAGAGKSITGKKVINRLRLMNIFGKKESDDHSKTKSDDGERYSISEKTAELSPIKSEENSYDDKFDLYFASSYLPHVPVANMDELDVLVENPSIHSQAFAQAGEMEFPPAPPQTARTRKRETSSMIENGSVLRPRNLTNAFSKTANTPRLAMNKTKKQIVSLGNDLIDAVEHSHSDFSSMLKRVSSERKATKLTNRFSKQVVRNSSMPEPEGKQNTTEPDELSTTKKTKKTMGDIKSYISQLRTGASVASESQVDCEQESSKNYQQFFKVKMELLAKTLSSAAPDTSGMKSSCTTHMCAIMECADDIFNPTLSQAGCLSSSSPLNDQWLEMDRDSDSVSKLTMPFHTSEFHDSNLSVASSVVSQIHGTRVTTVPGNYDF